MNTAKQVEEIQKKIFEKAFVVSDSRFILPHEKNSELAEQYFSGIKAWQESVIVVGNFAECFQYHTPEKAMQKILKYKEGFRKQFEQNQEFFKGENFEKEVLDAIYRIDPFLKEKDLLVFFKAFERLLEFFGNRRIFFVLGNLDYCLESFYKEYLSLGGKELGISFLHSNEVLRIENFEFYSINSSDNFPNHEQGFDSEISNIRSLLKESDPNCARILLSDIPSTRANPKLGSKKINDFLKEGLFDFHFFGHKIGESGRSSITTVDFQGISKKIGFYNAFIEKIQKKQEEKAFEEFVEKPGEQTTLDGFSGK